MFDINMIIVSWNTRGHLINCLNSLSRFKRNGWEIIVVDNGSSDGSREMVEIEFGQAKLIKNNKNLGSAKANNIGIRANADRYVCLVNSDIIPLESEVRRIRQDG